ncbi:hypothetical protein J1605_004359 [Eschrichtius robustus]|uniref:Secreted protein n=1 Tax=Eschrichtius robustus TaxID=9764 RepID=A0AB34HEM5_ESCRO|nr:hypothetical protein J1605_004359 [Eschrichtius robustus]
MGLPGRPRVSSCPGHGSVAAAWVLALPSASKPTSTPTPRTLHTCGETPSPNSPRATSPGTSPNRWDGQSVNPARKGFRTVPKSYWCPTEGWVSYRPCRTIFFVYENAYHKES